MSSGSPSPGLAVRARSLVAAADHGTLATLDPAGQPYTSLVELISLPDGDLAMLLSSLAEHHGNLLARPECCMLVTAGQSGEQRLAGPRAALQGCAQPLQEPARLRDAWLRSHPRAATYIDFRDFDFFVLRVSRVRFIGGFGRMGWLRAGDYRGGKPDPLAEVAPGAIRHMNEDHAEALLGYARRLAGADWAQSAEMVWLDSLGFELLARAGNRLQPLRVDFPAPVETAAELRLTLARMARGSP
jgi:putative heme iron utilization protein